MESLPHDVMQHILSFDSVHRLRIVSSKWNRLCNQNEANYLRELYSDIACSDRVRRKYIIHERRNKLHFVEQSLGFVFIHHSLSIVLEMAKPGDAIYMFNGLYKLAKWTHCLNKNVSIIGVQSNVFVFGSFHLHHCNVRFQNLNFIPPPMSATGGAEMIRVGKHSMLTLEGCRFKFVTTAIRVETRGSLVSDGCQFEGGCVAIKLSANAAMARITRCLFRNCGNMYPLYTLPSYHPGCIVIGSRCNGNHRDGRNVLLELQCSNNAFENNLCPSVSQGSDHALFYSDGFGGNDLSPPKTRNKLRSQCPIFNELSLNYNRHRHSDNCSPLKHGTNTMMKVAIF